MIPVFDIGDTLLESRPRAKKFFREALKQRGVENPPEYPFSRCNEYRRADLKAWLESEDVDVDVEGLEKEFRAEKRRQFERETAEILKGLEATPGFISDNSLEAKLFYRDLFNVHGIDFRGFVVSEEVGVEKPNAEIFEAFLERRGIDGDRCVYFGNRADIDSACELVGMDYVHVKQHDNFGTEWSGETVEKLTAEAVKRHI